LAEIEKFEPWKDKKLETLDQMVEDDPDLEDDEYMKQYREKRLAELKAEVGKPKFGSLIEIGRPYFEMQVNRAPKDVLVVIHLY